MSASASLKVGCIAAALVLGGGTSVDARRADEQTRPDIIVVMIDDMGAIDERVYERLPAIKALFLDSGLRYDHYYDETPLCCPARAQFLTGQHMATTGVDRNDARLFDPTETLATALRLVGYHTMIVGKYLNLTNKLAEKAPPGWDHLAINGSGYGAPTAWWVNGKLRWNSAYVTDAIRSKAALWIRGVPVGQPVFAFLTPFAPHGGVGGRPTPAPRHVGDPRCAGIPLWKPPSYDMPSQPDGRDLTLVCESLLAVDGLVARIRDVQAARGRPAVWVFTGDNGMAWGAHGYAQKVSPWADRLPLYVTGVGIPHGTSDALLSNIDLGPSLASAGSGDLPHRDGRVFDLAAPDSDEAILEVAPYSATYIPRVTHWQSVRTPQYRLIRWLDGSRSLYDVQADPWELDDLAGTGLTIESELEARLDALLAP